MSFVIFNKDTTRYLRIFRNRSWRDADFYATERAAKAGLTRAVKRSLRKSAGDDSVSLNIDDYSILTADQFALIEKTEIKTNLISGKQFTQSVNTPACCDPSTETYHSM